jgi:peroxiredoxin
VKKHTYFLILASLLIATMSAMAGIEPGDKAPAFSLLSAKGRQVNLSNYDGMYIVLEWLNHSCPQVQKNYDSGNMQATQKKQTAEGVVWLSILSSVPGEPGYTPQEEALKAAEEHGSDATEILLDPTGAVGKAYGATLTPEIFIIDPKGKVFYRGAFDSTMSTAPADIKEITNYVNLAIAEAKTGMPVSKAKTEPDGCVINYRE